MRLILTILFQKSGVEVTAQDLANSVYNRGNRSRVANAIRKAMRGEDISIVTFGGSITNGAGAVNPQIKFLTHSATQTAMLCRFTNGSKIILNHTEAM